MRIGYCRNKFYICRIQYTKEITNELYLIKELMINCAELGARKYQPSIQPKSDDITQLQAYKQFGEGWVKNCVNRDLVKKTRRGTAKNSPIYFSKIELLSVRNAEKAARLGVFDDTRL